MQDAIKQCGVDPSVKTLGQTHLGVQIYQKSAAAVELAEDLALALHELQTKLTDQQRDIILKVLELEHRSLSWFLQSATVATCPDLNTARADMIAQMRQISILAQKIAPIPNKQFTVDSDGRIVFV